MLVGLVALGALGAFAADASARGRNLVVNPSFERGVSGWTGHNAEVRVVRASAAPRGRRVAVVIRRKGWFFAIDDRRSTVRRPKRGDRFQATVFVKAHNRASAGAPVALKLTERAASGRVIKEWRVRSRATRKYKRLRVRATVRRPGHSLEVRLSIGRRKRRATVVRVDGFTLVRPNVERRRPEKPAGAAPEDSPDATDPGAGAAPPSSDPGTSPSAPAAPTEQAPPGCGVGASVATGNVQFNGLVLDRPAGEVFNSGGNGPGRAIHDYLSSDIWSGSSVRTLNSPAPFGAGKTFYQFGLPSSTQRAELSEPNTRSTAGMEDPAHTIAVNSTAYVATAFRFPVAPDRGRSWYLVMQIKNLVSMSTDLSPSLWIGTSGSGATHLGMWVGGGSADDPISAGDDIGNLDVGAWYCMIVGVNYRLDSRGWARVWIARQGQAMPPESAPTAEVTNMPTVHTSSRYPSAPGLVRVGPYHGSGDITLDSIGFARTDAYATARGLLGAGG